LHREVESCGNCHRRIDPYGLALENFNAIGQWRTHQDGEREHWGQNAPPIDAAGRLPGGAAFANLREFKQALMGQQKRFVRGLAEKLFVYATGRTVEPADHATIETLVQSAESGGYRLQPLLKALVRSEAFQTK
jgi:hypothetical protein